MKPKAPHALCDQCPLKNEPFVPSTLPEGATKMILGIAPGKQEVRQGKSFIGPSGKILNTALENAVIDRTELAVSNALLCKLPNNREAEEEELDCCMPRLIHEMAFSNITQILTLGKPARDVIMPSETEMTMMATRGRWRLGETVDVQVISTVHPAYILRGNTAAFPDMLEHVIKFSEGPRDVPEPKYLILNSRAQVEAVVRAAMQHIGPICVDIETSNIDMERSTPNEFWNGYILCVGIGWKPGTVFIVPEELFNSRKTLEILRRLFEDTNHGIFGQNIKFDLLYILKYYDAIIAPLKKWYLADDTLLMHFCLDERRGTHGLKQLATRYFDAPDYEAEIHRHLKHPKKDSYAKVPREKLYKYAAFDVDYTIRLRDILLEKLEAENLLLRPYRMILLPALETALRMECRGISLDEKLLSSAASVMYDKVVGLAGTLRDLDDEAGGTEMGTSKLNPNSPKQLAAVMYDKIGLPLFYKPRKKIKGITVNPRGTSKEVLTKIMDKHPFVGVLSKYRRWKKLHSTYATKLPNYQDDNGAVHFGYNLAGTEIGRVSAGLLLTIPRKFTPEGKMLRDCFVARPGHVILAADYSQAELRWGGWLAQEPFLYDIYKNDGDLHTEVAIAMFGENWTREQRMHTKMFNFSYLYGGSEWSFAEDSGLPINIAKDFVRRYDEKMPALAEYKRQTIKQVKTRGWLVTPVGRKRRFPIITQAIHHQLMNEATHFRPSSTSSDATLWAFSLASEYFRKKGWDAHPLIFMHDGVYFEVRDDAALIRNVGAKLRETMISVAEYIMKMAPTWYPEEYGGYEPIPFKADLEIGNSWGELKDYEL